MKINIGDYLAAAIFGLLILSTVAQAYVVSISLEIDRDDNVTFHGIKVQSGQRSVAEAGEYSTTFIDTDTSEILDHHEFDLRFAIASDPPVITDTAWAGQAMWYKLGTIHARVELKKGDVLLFSKNITFCDFDGTCEGPEEIYLTCPSDCPSGSEDSFCDGVDEDGICDPDCSSYTDDDCGKEDDGGIVKIDLDELRKRADEGQEIWVGTFLIIVILVAMALSLVYYNRHRLKR